MASVLTADRNSRNFVWDVPTLAWVVQTQAAGGGGAGDASAANQLLGNASVASIDTKTPTVGQKAMAASSPVVIASDQGKLLVTPDSVALPANQSVNNTQVAGTAIDVNSGVKSAGTMRVVIATDQPALTNKLLVTPDSVALPANQSVNAAQFGGTNVSTGAGAGGAGIPRITVSNDSSILGTKTGNNAAPGATNFGVIAGLANAAAPTVTEGNQVLLSSQLNSILRVTDFPPNCLGFYSVQGNTGGTYAGQAANTPLVSFRWTSSTVLAVIMKVGVYVVTSTAATAASIIERQLVIARSFSASDTGGTAVTMTGNNAKRRTSHATSVVGDLRAGNPLSAGTRTLDAQPVANAVGWSNLNMTGVSIGSAGGAPTGAVWGVAGGTDPVWLLNAMNGQEYPIVLAQNEGVIIRIGAAEPTSAVEQTYWQIHWAEVSAY